MEVLTINGHDYSHFIQSKGLSWSRNDIDSQKTVRTKNGTLRRDKITTKRKCTFTMISMTREQAAQLDDDLSADEFTATYLDLHGVQTRKFYCSSFSANGDSVDGEDSNWVDASFSMTEI